jgi:hypothetical protein
VGFSEYYDAMKAMVRQIKSGVDPTPSRHVALAVIFEAARSLGLVMLRWTEYVDNFNIPLSRRSITRFMSEYKLAVQTEVRHSGAYEYRALIFILSVLLVGRACRCCQQGDGQTRTYFAQAAKEAGFIA